MKITANHGIFMCLFFNVLQIWYLCDEYFRFEVTTSVRISIPDDIEFPSFTLCLNKVDTINWKKISVNLKKTLLKYKGDESYVKSDFDFDDVNVHIHITEEIIASGKDPFQILFNMVHNLKGPKELFNITFDFTELMKHGYGRIEDVNINLDHKLERMQDEVVIKDTFMLNKYKCYSVHLPKVNRISFDKLRASALSEMGVIKITQWIIYSILLPLCCDGLFYISSRDHFVTPVDTRLLWKVGKQTSAEYQTYEETLMPPPYRTNCRNYKEPGFSSRDHCRHQCLRSELTKRFSRLTKNVKLYENDNTSLLLTGSMWKFIRSHGFDFLNEEFVEATFQDLCAKQCIQPDCQSILHIFNSIVYNNNYANKSEILVSHSTNPVTVTLTQAAVPLISFLTNVFSTFGFWLGLSVMGSLSYVKRAKDTTVSRWRSLIWNQDGTSQLRSFIPRSRRRIAQTVRSTVRLFVRVDPRNDNEQNTNY